MTPSQHGGFAAGESVIAAFLLADSRLPSGAYSHSAGLEPAVMAGLQVDGVLATMYDARTLHSREVIGRLVEAFGDKVFETVIKRTIKFADATVAAEPITSYAGNHAGADSYRRLAKELIARGGAP